MKKQLIFQDSEEMKELQEILLKIRRKYSINLFTDINNLEKERIPVNIFSEGLSPLASITNFLHEQGLSTKEIAKKLNRSYKTIYQSLKERTKNRLKEPEDKNNLQNNIFIPINLFKNRNLSIMEIVISHLHKEKGLKFSEISRMINKDPRTVWTTWNRSEIKNAQISR